ncbi:MAG: hypothetical protein ACRDYB_05175 [Acidimicrobiales bacterium]
MPVQLMRGTSTSEVRVGVRVDSNERERQSVAAKPVDRVQREAMAFLRDDAGFAQVFTITRTGYPVGRTMVAPVNSDWSVDLVQRNVHHRLGQLRRDPHVEIVWVGLPQAGSVNDRPHVYDFGLLVPRVVFLRGEAVFMDDEATLEVFRRQTAIQRGRGLDLAPERSDENVRRELVGVHVSPKQVRAEGFGTGAQCFTWTIEEAS